MLAQESNSAARTTAQYHANQRPLSTPQAAHYLGLSKFTLEVWRSRGDGPRYLKLGRSVRYRVEDLDAFIEQSARSHTSETAEKRGVPV